VKDSKSGVLYGGAERE